MTTGVIKSLSVDGNNVTMDVFYEAVRQKLPEAYKNQLPVAEAGQTSFTGVGDILSQDSNFANIWHKTAVNLIARILFHSNEIVNPFAEFQGDLIANGGEIEELMVDVASTSMFNPGKAETTLFKRKKPELYSRIHSTVRDVVATGTLQDSYINQIFHGPAELDRYVISIVQSLVSGNETEKYYETKKLISNAVYNGDVRVVGLDFTGLDEAGKAKLIQKEILRVSKSMSFPSRYWNYGRKGIVDVDDAQSGIMVQARPTDLRLLLPIDTEIDLNVDFFANAFHLSAAQADLAMKSVDFFPDIWHYSAAHTVTQADLDAGYLDPEAYVVGDTVPAGTEAVAGATGATKVFNASSIQAVILDKRALIINPIIPATFSTQPNAKGRYSNIFLHDKSYYSYSPFMPAAVIVDATPPATTTDTDTEVLPEV